MSSTDGPRESFAALFESQGVQTRRSFHTGENVEVTIVLVAREAVFADLGGKQEGMFELPDLSDDAGNVQVKVGSRVMATVSSVDKETGQVRLKPVAVRAEADEAPVVLGGSSKSGGPAIVEGARVKGTVTGIERYGVFMQFAGTRDRAGRGLIPSMETGTPRNSDLKKHFALGQELEAKIVSIGADGKIRLSITAMKTDDERADLAAYQKSSDEKKADPAVEKPVRGFGTFGDLLKGVKPAAPGKKK